jgi:hypothetical protein
VPGGTGKMPAVPGTTGKTPAAPASHDAGHEESTAATASNGAAPHGTTKDEAG